MHTRHKSDLDEWVSSGANVRSKLGHKQIGGSTFN